MPDNITEKKLKPNQRKAIETLLTSGSATEAAENAGVSRNTLYRWMQEPDFQAALAEAEAAALDSLSTRLVGLADQAAGALDDVFNNDKAGIGHRLRAADIVLSNLLRLRELVTIEARLSELEKRQNESKS